MDRVFRTACRADRLSVGYAVMRDITALGICIASSTDGCGVEIGGHPGVDSSPFACAVRRSASGCADHAPPYRQQYSIRQFVPVPEQGKCFTLSFVRRSHSQEDMVEFCSKLPSRKPELVLGTPLLVCPTYVKCASDKRGFGIFAGTDIDPAKFKNPNACIATYGGVLCTEAEPRCREEIYRLPHGSLPRKVVASAQGYVSILFELI